jgi:hypothetical protein
MKKLILLASVVGMGMFASCASKKNCECKDSAGTVTGNTDMSSGSSSDREAACSVLSSFQAISGGKCELK